MVKNIAIIGSSGSIGGEFTKQLSELYEDSKVHAFSRNEIKKNTNNIIYYKVEYKDEESIERAASVASQESPLDMIIVATGILYDETTKPEKSLRDLSAKNFHRLFEINTVLPALIMKNFIPKLNNKSRSVFATLSARVGSISDNRLGGWYAYRGSKVALNMIIKNAAIEINRQNKQAIIVGLHPGTVDSYLSKPFQSSVPKDKLFTPEYSVKKLIGVMDNLTPINSGKCYSWDGQEVHP